MATGSTTTNRSLNIPPTQLLQNNSSSSSNNNNSNIKLTNNNFNNNSNTTTLKLTTTTATSIKSGPLTTTKSSNNNSSSTTTTTTNSLNNSLTISSNNLNTSNSSSVTVTADAATVAIAKDMLQLHHGSALSNNNNNSISNTTNNSDDLNSSPAHNNNNTNSSSASLNHNNRNNSNNTTTTTTPPAPLQQFQLQQQQRPPPPPDHAVGYLKYEDEFLYITEACTIIGRNSSTSHVHFHVAENNLVSRKHFQVLFDADTRDFYVQCLSKNGIFVDDFLQRRNADPLKLPASCYFRFPSTEIRIQFESFLHTDSPTNVVVGGVNNLSNNSLNNNHHHNISSSSASSHHLISGHGGGSVGNVHQVIISPASAEELHQQQLHGGGGGGGGGGIHQMQHISSSQQQQQHLSSSGGSHLLPMDNSNVIYSPLKISIPKKEQKSPYLSPTGTISAANSCPASPRQGFHQNQNNYNNYSNNNLQNQQDLFQTPSTASYNHNEKPPYSYAQLIVQAISAAPDKQLTLSGIYSFIVKHYPYYRKETNKGWQNSIRHNLSLNRYFIKVARSQDEPGKGSFWRIDPDSGAKLIDHSYKKRRQRSSQGFRPSYGMPRSAPVSPSHMGNYTYFEYSADNSRESSPLQDIVLQSAPGSPGMSLENRNVDNEIIYQNQNIQQSSANNTQQFSSPYYITNQNTIITQQHQQEIGGGGGGGGGGGVGALIALKRNHAMAAGTGGGGGNTVVTLQQQQQHHQQNLQGLHPDIIYEEMPTDYSGNMESGDDECDAGAKRPKVEVL
ncbi:probable serine/threonine-protein kinase DDB_G0276461 isoform X2 [Lucilia sericata]|uniref:probable serine/threonine-protein kinase DDB_G0276461 isoform X2 n=1 Tax=Lucilia sericata TaxID=13632 RepID=UPI0018A87F7C|nr:probable serine/threonine-protein kinase DDB_G0276461 isoform X2 [Lucilia sericata]